MTITTRDSLLTIRGLSASVDETPILHDIDLAVGPGETHVIMGPNGAGKSTLGHVVMGDAAYRVDGGSVEFDGRDITDLSPDKRSRAGLFLSFQAPVEIPGVPLSSFLRATVAGRDGKELKGKQFKKHVRALADELDMDPSYLDRELGVGFSGGEKKKLEMLQLLLLEPKLAILDETDSGLDVDALGVVSRGIDAYRRATGGALVVITHNTRIRRRPSARHGARPHGGRGRLLAHRIDQRAGLRAVRASRCGSGARACRRALGGTHD